MSGLDLSNSDQEICDADKELLYKVAKAMVARRTEQDNHNIPAGYTYLGQFIAHDLTFHDTRGTHFSSDYEPVSNIGGRAALDLRSLYGGGPKASPLLYEVDEVTGASWRFRLSRVRGGDPTDANEREDLLRFTACPFAQPTNDCKHLASAAVGDQRNDENLIISQLAVLFCRVHNKIAVRVAAELGMATIADKPFEVFNVARRLTTACYRKIVLNDYLQRLLHPSTYRRLVRAVSSNDASTFTHVTADQIRNGFTAPKDFSFAAFRVGHTMVQDKYNTSEDHSETSEVPDPAALITLLDLVRPSPDDLPITTDWLIKWEWFFFDDEDLKDRSIAENANFSHSLNVSAPVWLGHRFPWMAWRGSDKKHGVIYRDLIRSQLEGVPTTNERGIAPPTLDELRGFFSSEEGRGTMTLLEDPELQTLAQQLPIYLYVLMEAESLGGERLGPFGSSLVGEVIVGAILTDRKYPGSAAFAETIWSKLFGTEIPGDMVTLRKFDSIEDAIAW